MLHNPLTIHHSRKELCCSWMRLHYNIMIWIRHNKIKYNRSNIPAFWGYRVCKHNFRLYGEENFERKLCMSKTQLWRNEGADKCILNHHVWSYLKKKKIFFGPTDKIPNCNYIVINFWTFWIWLNNLILRVVNYRKSSVVSC